MARHWTACLFRRRGYDHASRFLQGQEAPVSGNTRTLTCASKTATASGSGDPTHIVFVNTATSKILAVTQESSGVTVSTGTSYSLPSIVLEMRQPVAV